MNKKGGYQIIDLKDFNFTKTTPTLTILYDDNKKKDNFFNTILRKNSKVILFTNIVINGVEKNDIFIEFNNIENIVSNELYFIIYGYESNIVEERDRIDLSITVN